ncbi:hypothetical protein JRO89_XS11G0100300 [Xanthoceras sorbifolium]|uniref:Retrotransposon gag domain-containing protein n=1 Tax=Xanthoceras sorbifolium TaxID=99658 RepID=A0ABQ8HF95_9ROSI|nr:hypothetical protein JRO89_XS11G0100300 [Xanthoceras sorbifolium]
MYCRGRPRIRRVAAERSAPEGERVDESMNAPTQETPLKPAQPAVPEGGNLNAAQMAEVMGCTEELMVTYLAFLLKDRAKDWWKALQRRHPEGITRPDFQREFKDRLYPKSYKYARIEEFFRLEQGSLSVAEYEKKFSDLIRVVHFIADNEEQKANRFTVGLNSRTYVSSAAHT